MGIGWALFEEMIIDAKSGVVRNPNLLDYKMPTMPDLPQLESAFVEINEPQSAYGHKSLGRYTAEWEWALAGRYLKR